METGRERVLVIEDDAKFGRLVGLILARSHDVLVATQAQEALDHIAAGKRFDLILCDLMMPGVSGVDFHERVGRRVLAARDRVSRARVDTVA